MKPKKVKTIGQILFWVVIPIRFSSLVIWSFGTDSFEEKFSIVNNDFTLVKEAVSRIPANIVRIIAINIWVNLFIEIYVKKRFF